MRSYPCSRYRAILDIGESYSRMYTLCTAVLQQLGKIQGNNTGDQDIIIYNVVLKSGGWVWMQWPKLRLWDEHKKSSNGDQWELQHATWVVNHSKYAILYKWQISFLKLSMRLTWPARAFGSSPRRGIGGNRSLEGAWEGPTTTTSWHQKPRPGGGPPDTRPRIIINLITKLENVSLCVLVDVVNIVIVVVVVTMIPSPTTRSRITL